jgi:hypothetical protein
MPSLEQALALSNSSDPGSVSTLARRNRLTRFLSTLPLSSSFHRFLRDNFFAVVCDTFVYMGAPLLLLSQGLAGLSFLSLVPLLSRIKIRVPYAPSRTVDLFLARDFASRVPPTSSHKSRLILFVHGGAWGSGSPSMYRPLALGLLRRGFDVGLVGYRVYPAGDVDGQCEDVSKAVAAVESWSRSNSVSWSSVTLAGHSSGANISLVSLLRSPSPFVTKLALLSGVHDLAVHSDYEAMRGLEELSPLKSAAGFSRDAMFAGGARGGLGGLRPGFPEVRPAPWLERQIHSNPLTLRAGFLLPRNRRRRGAVLAVRAGDEGAGRRGGAGGGAVRGRSGPHRAAHGHHVRDAARQGSSRARELLRKRGGAGALRRARQ